MSRAPTSCTFFWWQDGQNQRPLQENASRYSCVQWSHRTRATPRARSPQSRNVVHGLRDEWAQEPVTGLIVLLIAGETRSDVPGQALPERRGLRLAGTIDLLHHAAQCREEGVSSNGTPQKKVWRK